jgi:hypothetical protein
MQAARVPGTSGPDRIKSMLGVRPSATLSGVVSEQRSPSRHGATRAGVHHLTFRIDPGARAGESAGEALRQARDGRGVELCNQRSDGPDPLSRM